MDSDPLASRAVLPAEQRDRIAGSLLGLAIGDALGTTLEFTRRDSGPPITDIVGGGPFGLAPGQWTDDTSMALCIAASLVETGAFDPRDQLDRFLRWRQHGYMSSTGRCFDIGTQTSASLDDYRRTGEPYRPDTRSPSAGNGSLMRLAPVPLAFCTDIEHAGELAAASSRTTHPAPECVDACRAYGRLIAMAVAGVPKSGLFAAAEAMSALIPSQRISAVLKGSYLTQQRSAISSSGYVVHSLEAALWAFARTDDFEAGALLAVNLGDDSDTVGAIYGQLAGAHYGSCGIPARWLEVLHAGDMIVDLAGQLAGRAGTFGVQA